MRWNTIDVDGTSGRMRHLRRATVLLVMLAMGTATPALSAQTATPATGSRTASGLWYSVRGSGNAVVLVHGSNLDSRSLAPLADAFARDHRVVELDLRFHGQSGEGEGPFSFEEDVREVMDAAGVARATVIGHSLGGRVAIDLALMAPSRVERLVLLAPGLGGRAAMRAPEGFEAMVQALRARDFVAASDALGRMPVMALQRDTTRQPFVQQMVRDNARLFSADPRRMRSTGAPANGRLGEIALPVLVITGGADPTESNDVARDILAGIRDARGEALAGCGHLLPLDCPDDLIRVVRAFMR